jgi:hypothetical protein
MPPLFLCTNYSQTVIFLYAEHKYKNMESVYHFVSENSVLLLNGSFVQSAAAVRYEKNEPLFVTVLPLNATYLPYTVEILGGKAVTNAALAVCCAMEREHYYIELKQRSAYVFSPDAMPPVQSAPSLPAQLLRFVREQNYAAARLLLSPRLSETITDNALGDFFEGVIEVRENTFTPQKGWLLVKDDGTAPICDIEFADGRIDNVTV